MTHYIVKHADDEIRLHADDGSEPIETVFTEHPSTNDLADEITAAGPGGSLLGNQTLRRAFVDVVSNGIKYRDLTVEGETVPWQ